MVSHLTLALSKPLQDPERRSVERMPEIERLGNATPGGAPAQRAAT
jgi:hypothetical protein